MELKLKGGFGTYFNILIRVTENKVGLTAFSALSGS